jgi:predicted RNase H-like HicB family nuclease
MTRTYLVVFERGGDGGWGAFAPDLLGTGGLGASPQEARESLREGIGYMLKDLRERGETIPEAKSMTIDFSEFDPNPQESHYEVEWLTVEVPEAANRSQNDAQQAA